LGAIAPSRSQTSFAGSAPRRARQRAIPKANVRELLREHQRTGEGARVGQLAGHDVAATGLAVADRDLAARLAEVELRQLAGAVAGALKAARRRQKAGPQLAQEVVEDPLATAVAQRLELLTDTHARERGLIVKQLLDRRQKRMELRAPLRPRAVARRLRRGERLSDRVAVNADAAVDLALREPLNMLHPPDLRPLLHAKQRLPPVSINRSSQINVVRPDTSGPAPRWTTIRPAQTDQYSGGTYKRQLCAARSGWLSDVAKQNCGTCWA
jgi:hypothetical protein